LKAGQGGSTVAELIRNALQTFVVTDDPDIRPPPPNQCTKIGFDVIPAALPGALEYQVNITPNLNTRPLGSYVAQIQLVCRQEIAQGVGSNDPGADTGEVLPSQPDFDEAEASSRSDEDTRRRRKPKPKPKKTPKKSAKSLKKKRSAKKVSRKPTKKTAKKVRKRNT